MNTPTIKDLVARLEAHEAFLMTPEGKAWKKIQEATEDYLDLLPTIPAGFQSTAIIDVLKGGFKMGELSIMLSPPRPSECKSDFTGYMVRKHLQENPDAKVVWPVSFEWSKFEEERFNNTLAYLGIERTEQDQP